MITLVRNKEDAAADEIEHRFRDLSLAYELEIRAGLKQPYILDGSQKIDCEKQFEEWLLKLERELRTQRMVSGDACYIDPDSGSVC